MCASFITKQHHPFATTFSPTSGVLILSSYRDKKVSTTLKFILLYLEPTEILGQVSCKVRA